MKKKVIAVVILMTMVCTCLAEVKVHVEWNGHLLEQTTVKFTDDTGYVKINVDGIGEIITMVPFEGTFVMFTCAGNRIDMIDYGTIDNYTDFRSMVDLNLAIEMIHLRSMAAK